MMKKLKRMVQHEEGQSLIIVGALLIVLVALIGLVVDAGNAYAQRRIVQNAADAAALAGSQMLVRQEDYLTGGNFLRNWQVIQAVEEYAERNGVDPDNLSIYYTDIDGNILADARFDLGRQDIINEDTFGGTRAEGIRVDADLPFPTYLVRVIGRNEMTASASSNGILACGACTAGGGDEGLFPIAVYVGLFDASDGRPVLGQRYRIFEKDEHFPGTGSFGWLSWDGDPSNPTLIANMTDTSRSGQWSVGDMVPTSVGLMVSRGVRDALKNRIDNRVDLNPSQPATVTLPIFDYTEGNGQNKKYHIIGFGRFRLECYHASRSQYYGPSCNFDRRDNEKWIAGTFVKWVDPTGEAGCTNFGICSAKLRPPLEVKRTLVGNVIPWQVRPAADQICEGGDQPVDLVHIIDISGSMCYEWDGTYDQSPPCTGRADYGSPNRIYAAKQIITDFNEGMNWHPDNQVGLATYPSIESSSSYRTVCYQALGSNCNSSSNSDCYHTGYKRYLANKDVPLTSDLAYVNSVIDNLRATGATPLPVGLQYGRELVSDPDYHKPGNTKVIILTTDGMPNVPLDGKWTGYRGRYTRPYWIVESGCNDSVYQQAIEQANLAKQDGTIIFTIGIHTSIDEDLMRAIASPDTDPTKPHFFLAESDMDFGQIYDQIMDRLPTICSEECVANENATVGAGATVRLYDDNGNLVATTTADASGGFIFTDLEPGTYELRASWTDPQYGLLYDVLTWVLGGPPLASGEKITVEIPQGTGSTHKDVYLRTSEQIDCNN
ncbi:MAG TPA: VWA domain-containing protein [Anaerolineae bacterium]|nr:VWA domain-containing protein [Anaerolineae bacterium]